MIQLRPYQLRAIEQLRAAYRRGRRAVVLVLPTAGGKTIIAAEIIRLAIALGHRVLFVAHRTELITQTVAKLAAAGITDLRVIQADRDEGSPSAPILVGSVWTLTLPRCADLPPANLIVVDECHRHASASFRRVTDRHPAARLLGLTATPIRSDGLPLDMYDELVVGATVAELTALGALVPCRVLYPATGQLEPGQLALTPLEAYTRFASGERAIVFCSSVKHARAVAAELNAGGVPAEAVTGDAPRADTLARFAAGETRAVTTVHVLTEGVDIPAAQICILARMVGHAGAMLQAVGRVLRPSPETGKTQAVLVDLCGAVLDPDIGTPDMDRTWSLEGRATQPVLKDAIRHCGTCGSVSLAGGAACPYCATAWPVRERALPRSTGVGVVEAAPGPRREYGGPVTRTQTRDEPCSACRNVIRRGDEYRWYRGARRAVHIRCPLPAVPARSEVTP